MWVVVTGVAGFIGSRLTAELLARGNHVLGVDCFLPQSYDPEIKRARLLTLLPHNRFEFVEADLREAELEALLAEADVVINEAAMPGLVQSWSDLETYVSCNLLAVDRLVRASRKTGVKSFVHASTSSVYGRYAVGDEGTPTEPVSPYGVTKLAAEKLILAHVEESSLPAVILRYFSIYGPGQRPDMAYHRFAEALLDELPLTIYGDGLQSRTNTYVEDCVAGTLLAVEHGRPGEIYNIGGGEGLTLLGAIALLSEALEVEPEFEFHPPRPGDQRDTAANIIKANRQLGYEPRVLPRDGLFAQAEWHSSLRQTR